ncbi:trypsin-3-like isoform X1 [Neocloeon triangulifer]|uniref:trypsin-3-like isoform X1 n=1 Tax=Neocloeon triangulifer TaxID=2078957 RepID=UPI00286F20AA|nr:trypsin-3-like isoform X1 [Neocloeon triangulifer]
MRLNSAPNIERGASIENGASSRIVGGSNSSPGEFPYMVAILFKNRTMCGGTILNENYILTAAHCMHNLEMQYFEILSGSNLLSESTVHNVTELKKHEEFIFQQNLPNDVGLMRVDPPFVFGSMVQPVSLIDQGIETNGSTAFGVAVGWGMAYSGSSYPNEQKKVEQLDVYTDQECIDAYIFGPTERSICAGMSIGSSSEVGICGGDAGGPLIVDGLQVGIISWARVPCGEPGFPAVFAEVSYYTDWIKLNSGMV